MGGALKLTSLTPVEEEVVGVAIQAEEVEVILEVEVEVTPEAEVTLVAEAVATVVNKAVMEAKVEVIAAEVVATVAQVAKTTSKVATAVDIDPPKFQMNDFRSNMLLSHAFHDDTRRWPFIWPSPASSLCRYFSFL